MQTSQIIQNLEKEMKAFDRFSKKVYNKSSNINLLANASKLRGDK